MAEIIYNGKSSKEFGLRLTNNVAHELSSNDIETVPVPGRDGVLLIDNKRLKPVERGFPFRMYEDVVANSSEISEWLGVKGWHDLELSWDSDFVYRATIINTIAIEEVLRQLGKFQAVFLVHPIKYYKDSLTAQPVSNGEVVLNRGNVPAQPKLELTGNGNTTITINGRKTVLENVQGSIVLDMQKKMVYRDGLPEWDKLVREEGAGYPYLDPGENTISWTGAFTVNLTKNEGVRI